MAQSIVDNGLAEYYRSRDALREGRRERCRRFSTSCSCTTTPTSRKVSSRELGQNEQESIPLR
ncbi:MAG: hypothetical protein IPF44_12960 [Betaproteobacteria bacterium]|nr:hypothetical protein [Betaproteobacteria bacterium]